MHASLFRKHLGALADRPRALVSLVTVGLLVSRIGATYNSPILLYESAALLVAVKLVKAAVLIALGLWLARVGLRGVRPLVGLSGLMLLVCIACGLAEAFGAGNAGLRIVMQASSGANEAIVLLLYVLYAAGMPRGAAVLCGVTTLASAFALAVAAGPLVIPTWACLMLRCLGVALLVPLFAVPVPPDAPVHVPEHARKPGTAAVAALILVCFAVNAVGGFFISLPNIGGFSVDSADWGVIQSILVLAEALLTALLAWRPGLASHPLFLLPSLAWCMLALLLLPLDWPAASVNLGVVGVHTGRNVFELCSWAWALSLVDAHGRKGLAPLGLVLGVSTLYFGTALSLVFRDPVALSREAFLYAGIVAAIVLAACACVPLALSRARSDSHASTLAADGDVARALAEFDARLLGLIESLALSERETAVLVDAVHGYSADVTGERLGYSRDAVKFSLTKIYARAGVSSRQELLRLLDDGEAN